MRFLRLLLVFGTASTAAAGRAQAQYAGSLGQPINGISCDAQEGQRIHIHQHIVIFDHGNQLAIPPNIGQPAGKQCIYWLHTHTPDGIIHIEAPKDRSFTLGEFFAVWGQPLSKTQAAAAHADAKNPMKVWVDGKPYTGNPAAIKLKAHTDIVIEVGPPFPTPPRFTNWGTL